MRHFWPICLANRPLNHLGNSPFWYCKTNKTFANKKIFNNFFFKTIKKLFYFLPIFWNIGKNTLKTRFLLKNSSNLYFEIQVKNLKMFVFSLKSKIFYFFYPIKERNFFLRQYIYNILLLYFIIIIIFYIIIKKNRRFF